MWKYEEPEMDVITLDNLGVIYTSGVTDGGIIEDDDTPETPFKPPSGVRF